MKKSDALWKKFYAHVLRVMKSVGAQRVADQWSDDRWLLDTAYGSLQLTLHDPKLTGAPTFSVFGRFLGSGPFPSGANSYSGKLNFHMAGDPKKITDADMEDFFRRLQGRLEAISVLGNPVSEKSETVILNWRPGGYRDEKLITATWSGGVMWGRPSWDSDAEREIKSRILKVVPGAKFRWAGAKVDAETRADLAADARKMNPRRVPVKVTGYYVYTPADGEEERDPFRGMSLEEAKERARYASKRLRDAGLPVESTVALVNTDDGQAITVWSCDAKTCDRKMNPLKRRRGESERDFMRRCMSAEKESFPQQRQRVAVCLSKARKNPAEKSSNRKPYDRLPV